MAALAVDSLNSVVAGAPNTSDGIYLGTKSTSKIGFYGTTPIAKATIPTAATGTQIAAFLNSLGLCNLS